MKKGFILFFSVLLLFACRQSDVIEKPDHLLKEEEMVNILYDLALLQSIRAHHHNKLEEKNIVPKTYIYKKYNIDSITLAQNHKYYASRLEQYKTIQKKVAEKLRAEKDKIVPPAPKAKPEPAGSAVKK